MQLQYKDIKEPRAHLFLHEQSTTERRHAHATVMEIRLTVWTAECNQTKPLTNLVREN